MEEEGEALLYFPIFNYSHGNMDQLAEMLTHPSTAIGLSDGGAHCATICDSSIPTYMLTHWGRDRRRGTLPLEKLVAMQTNETAELYDFPDRGRLAPGLRADVNIIDTDNLAFAATQDDLRPPRRRQAPTPVCASPSACRSSSATSTRPKACAPSSSATSPPASPAAITKQWIDDLLENTFGAHAKAARKLMKRRISGFEDLDAERGYLARTLLYAAIDRDDITSDDEIFADSAARVLTREEFDSVRGRDHECAERYAALSKEARASAAELLRTESTTALLGRPTDPVLSRARARDFTTARRGTNVIVSQPTVEARQPTQGMASRV